MQAVRVRARGGAISAPFALENVPLRQLLRAGCAGLGLITIAALTSIGLYAIVAGGLVAPGASNRAPSAGVPVLVTIQVGSATPTAVAAAPPLATAPPAETPTVVVARPAASAQVAGAPALRTPDQPVAVAGGTASTGKAFGPQDANGGT